MPIGEKVLYQDTAQPVLPAQPVSPARFDGAPARRADKPAPPPPLQQTVTPMGEAPPVPPSQGPPPVPGSKLPLGMLLKIGIGVGVFFLLLFLVVALILPRFSKPPASQHVTLTYWGLWEDSAIMQPLIDGFERSHPNISITYLKQDPNQYLDRVTTRIKNGTGPDIFRFHNSWMPVLSGSLLPFSKDTLTTAQFGKDFYPVMQTDLVRNGAIYGVPLELDTLSLFVNTDILKSAGVTAPKTWTDFVSDAKAMTVKNQDGTIKTAGAAMGTFDNVEHAPDILSMLFAQQGVEMSRFAASRQDVTDALTFYTSFAKGQDNVWDQNLDNSLSAFAKGNLAMYFGYSWDILALKAMSPDLQFAIYPVPSLYGRGMSVASYWVEGVSATTRHPKEALAFMKYLTQKDTEQTFYSATVNSGRLVGEPYARQDLAPLLKDNPLAFVFVDQGKDAISSYFIAKTSDGDHGINSIVNTYLGNAVRSILGDTSPESAATTLIDGVSKTLASYGQQ